MNIYFLLSWTDTPWVNCNISTVFKGSGKGLYYVSFRSIRTPNISYYGTCNGNISVWSDCYDLEHIYAVYQNISGELSSLSKLQKLNYVMFTCTSVTGAKEDLYNNGANITTFKLELVTNT